MIDYKTTITIIGFIVPKELTLKGKYNKVLLDYSCECYLDNEGNVGHENEYFAFKAFDAFKIANDKAIELVAKVRSYAEVDFRKKLKLFTQLN